MRNRPFAEIYLANKGTNMGLAMVGDRKNISLKINLFIQQKNLFWLDNWMTINQ